jgi:hypothetical protein
MRRICDLKESASYTFNYNEQNLLIAVHWTKMCEPQLAEN